MSKTDHVGVQESSSRFNLNSELNGRQNRRCRLSCTDFLDIFEKLLQNTFKIKVILPIRCTLRVSKCIQEQAQYSECTKSYTSQRLMQTKSTQYFL